MSTIWSMHWVHYQHYCILFVHFPDILRTTVSTAECPQLFNFIATFNNWINGWFETQYCSVRCWCPLTVTCHALTVMRNAPRDAARAGDTTFIPIVMPNSSPAVTSDRLHLFLLHFSNSVYPEYLIHILIIWSLREAIPNQLEKLEAAKAAWQVCLSLLGLT